MNASVLVLHLAPDLQVEALKKLIKNALEAGPNGVAAPESSHLEHIENRKDGSTDQK